MYLACLSQHCNAGGALLDRQNVYEEGTAHLSNFAVSDGIRWVIVKHGAAPGDWPGRIWGCGEAAETREGTGERSGKAGSVCVLVRMGRALHSVVCMEGKRREDAQTQAICVGARG